MDFSPSLRQENRPSLHIRQQQQLMMLPHMQQGLYLLQMPLIELSDVIDEEWANNPFLDCIEKIDKHEIGPLPYSEDRGYDATSYIENRISYAPSLFSHLMQQARQTFTDIEDITLAEMLIGNLDAHGFLTTPFEEISKKTEKLEKLLYKIQEFEPYGIGARTIQESLLIQLRCQGKEHSIAYAIISKHYTDLLYNRISFIQQGLQCSVDTIFHAIDHFIVPLNLRPGSRFTQSTVPYIVPDAKILPEGGKLIVEINEERLPSLKLNAHYIELCKRAALSKEDKKCTKEQIHSAKWLIKNLQQRHETLLRVIETVIEKQKPFFSQDNGSIFPLTMQEVASELNLHISTVARAVANKYIHCDSGLYPLRSFFSRRYLLKNGQEVKVSSIAAMLQKLIHTEDKYNPYSDAHLASLLEQQGITCARRTIAKYRNQLQIGNAQKRKQFHGEK